MEATKTNSKRKKLLILASIVLLLAVSAAVLAVCFLDDFRFWQKYDVRYEDLRHHHALFGVKEPTGETLTLPAHTPDGEEIESILYLALPEDRAHKGIKTIVIPDSYRFGRLDLENFPDLERLVIGKNFDFSRSEILSPKEGLTVEIDSEHPLYRVEGGSVLSKDGKTLIACFDAREIPASVEVIADDAFSYDPHCTALVIPDGVRKIGRFDYERHASLTAIYLPDGVTEFEGQPFDQFYYLFSGQALTVVFESETLPIDTETGEVWQPHEGLKVSMGTSLDEFKAFAAID